MVVTVHAKVCRLTEFLSVIVGFFDLWRSGLDLVVLKLWLELERFVLA